MIQQSLVLIKPEAVKRGIVGEILNRFERANLKIVGAKLIVPTRELAERHYEKDDEWKIKIGKIRLEDAEKHNLDIMDLYGTTEPIEIGALVNKANHDYLVSGPVLAFVLEGVNAVQKIRVLVGPTFANEAPAGTIRGDYSSESSYTSVVRKRTVFNIIHASGNEPEAKFEISLWFKPEEIISYRRVHEDLYGY
ncbi:nucleoside-diphosphate kinase [Candidatus Nomurabacteria bacterium]|uniref:nucleoside-diphosphate kinase n=1 Tax=candidate division WWE3 bacterium TaxID=2053526 RepID=A0A955E003_UNCKA|nr:nucleoside-diphosphate kinase [candidate division WWE3 bacterium]MCB9823606.1 nucleoside-diphosphate kinase [Candidatus Nomurabacteria bacterium]MCB9827401.1 nucleoside-diphosphate kinase [Candidatus Nomurabacteria bacterium]HXK52652.1 nucleoside-diphosphate kinase [bacterium]